MIERFKSAYRAFVARPQLEPEPEQPLPNRPACPRCGSPGERLSVQRDGANTKTHWCQACQKFYKTA